MCPALIKAAMLAPSRANDALVGHGKEPIPARHHLWLGARDNGGRRYGHRAIEYTRSRGQESKGRVIGLYWGHRTGNGAPASPVFDT